MLWFILGVVAFVIGALLAFVVRGDMRGVGCIALIVACIMLGVSLFSTIPTGYTGILTTFGKVNDNTIEAGLNVKAPWQSIVLMDNREQTKEFKFLAFSSDMQEVTVAGHISFAIDKTAAMNLYRSVGKNYYDILVPHRLEESGRVLVSQRSAEQLIASREALAPELLTAIRGAVEPYGLNIISISLDIDFSDSFTDAIEAKQVATQVLQKTQTEQEQETMIAQQQAERQKIAAQAKADVAKLEAEAEAYSVRIKAEAEAAANELVSQSLTDGLIKYMETNLWNGQLPTTYIGGDYGVLPIIDPD